MSSRKGTNIPVVGQQSNSSAGAEVQAAARDNKETPEVTYESFPSAQPDPHQKLEQRLKAYIERTTKPNSQINFHSIKKASSIFCCFFPHKTVGDPKNREESVKLAKYTLDRLQKNDFQNIEPLKLTTIKSDELREIMKAVFEHRQQTLTPANTPRR